jgi:4-hydroxy-tetrahydrodipicolinate synthase
MNTVPSSPFGPLATAMVTPFKPDGTLDIPRAQQLAQRLVENGSTSLVVAGTTAKALRCRTKKSWNCFAL